MKALRKTSILLLAILISQTGFSTEDKASLKIRKSAQKSIIVQLDQPTKKDFKITLKDQQSVVLLEEEVVQSKHFAKNYNLKNLPDGDYFLEIEDEFLHTDVSGRHTRRSGGDRWRAQPALSVLGAHAAHSQAWLVRVDLRDPLKPPRASCAE